MPLLLGPDEKLMARVLELEVENATLKEETIPALETAISDLSAALTLLQHNIRYRIVNDEAHVTGYYGPGGWLTIPATLGGKPVTTLKSSFRGYEDSSKLTGLWLPDGLTTIEETSCYGLAGLSVVWFPDSLVSIGSAAFTFCRSLKEVRLGADDISIGSSAFSYCSSLSHVMLFGERPSLGSGAFSSCTSLVLTQFNHAFVAIGLDAFSDCPLLSSIDLPIAEGATIDMRLFNSCNSLYMVRILGSLPVVPDYFIQDCHSLEYVSLPSGVVSINQQAFNNCHALKRISFDGLIAPTNVSDSWLLGIPLLQVTVSPPPGSNFPAKGQQWNGAVMGDTHWVG